MTDPGTGRWFSADNDDTLAAEWLDGAERMDRMLAPFGDRMLALADLRPGQTVLDIGCGTGATTLAAWTRVAPSGTVIGVDISRRMLDAAQMRAAAVPGHRISFICADAQTHPFQPGQADVAVSRFGVGHFRDPAAAFTNIAAGLRITGRLVVTEWADPAKNEWMTLADTVAARVLPERRPHRPHTGPHDTPGAADALPAALHEAGMSVDAVDLVRDQLRVGHSVPDVMEWFLTLPESRVLLGLSERQRRAFREALSAELTLRAGPGGVYLTGAAHMIEAHRLRRPPPTHMR
jgi:SAM-dependent methyltransferase